MSFNGQQKLTRGEKPKGILKGNQTKHLWGWTRSPIKANYEMKWSKAS
jgi:hypothetical protein